MSDIQNKKGERIVINGLEIDPVIFTQGFVDFCDISKCEGECCHTGVWIDLKERDVILAHKDLVLQYMDETQTRDISKWFGNVIEDDEDFESGKCLGTEVHNDKCVFQMQTGYCVLQSAAMQTGMSPWAIKPKFCVMYPIVIAEGVLTYDDDHAAEMHYCGLDCHQNHTRSAFESCGAEIEYALGTEGYKILNDHYEEHKDEYRAEYERVKQKGLVQIALPDVASL